MRAITTVAVLLLAGALASGCRRHREDSTEPCTRGAVYTIACDNMGVGRCSGDAVLRVCDGLDSTVTCQSGGGTELAEDDDSGGSLCPRIDAVTCPESGAFTVTSRAYSDSRSFRCDWRIEPVGGSGPPPVEPDAGP